MTIQLVTIEDLNEAIANINQRMTLMEGAHQSDIDALTAQINQVAGDLDVTRTRLQTEIDSLAGQGVDVTALQAAVAPLDDAVKSLGDIQPTPPPAPEPPAQ